jgi:hypothetical protein
LTEGLSDGADGQRDAEAARSLEPSQSPGAAGGGLSAVDRGIETEVAASDDLIPATYIHTRAETAAANARHDYELSDPTEAVSGSTDVDAESKAENPGPGGLAALWGMVRALGGTRRPDDQGANDKSRDESDRRR